VAQNATIIDVVVRTDQEVLECMLGNDGVLEGAAPGALVLLHSTIRPTTTKKVAELAADKRVNVIDACMTAVPRVVREGGLTFLVGGQKAFFQRAKPHLMNMAKDAVHMGPLGCGNVTKLFKNMVTASEALIVYEALQIAKAGGVSYKAALDLMQKTKSQHILDRWDTRYEFADGELKFNPGTNLYDKDLPLAAEVGKTLGADIPIVEAMAKLGVKLNGGKVSI
jgi:2-hydroxy-3-oxopropionate reductase